MLEKNYGKTITEMCLVCMHPENKNGDYIKLVVPDLSDEINDLMELRKVLIHGQKLNTIKNFLKDIETKLISINNMI